MSGDEKIERVYVHFFKALAVRDFFFHQAFRSHHHGRGQHLDICSLANGFMQQGCLGFKIGQRGSSEWELKSDPCSTKASDDNPSPQVTLVFIGVSWQQEG